MSLPVNLCLDIKKSKLKKWLAKPGIARVAVQNPWFVAYDHPDVNCHVTYNSGTPQQIIEEKGLMYVIRPELVVDLEDGLRTVKLDSKTIGFQFCEPSAIPAIFRHRQTNIYEQIVQYPREFDTLLKGSSHRHLRQNVARTERQDLTFCPDMDYSQSEISDLVIAWTSKKKFTELVSIERGLKTANRIRNVYWTNPFGVLYGARDKDGQLRAVAAVLEMGDFASIECIASHRDSDRAQEYLELNMWQQFARKGIEVVSRGNKNSQSSDLLSYKAKFSPLHVKQWAYAKPLVFGTPKSFR